jgi:4,5-dihydroxyphthalate decarboxylase
MSKVKLSFACGPYDRMRALQTRDVQPDGIDLDFVAIDSARSIFDRMAGRLEFDVAEMSSSEFISRKSAGQCPFVALPVFPSRVFRHGFISINTNSGIRRPRDLEGKRVGVALYTMTAAIWLRGHLQHDYGVDLSRIHWVQGSINSPGAHGEPSVMPLLKNIPVEINRSGKSLSQLIDAGAIDATMGTSLPAAMRHNPAIRRLFPNFREVEKQYYQRTGIFPIMHLVAIRKDVYERHPFIASSLYKAFCESKQRAISAITKSPRDTMLPWMVADLEEIDEVFGQDFWPYGVEPNRHTLQTLVSYMVEQSLIAGPISADDLFVPVDPM